MSFSGSLLGGSYLGGQDFYGNGLINPWSPSFLFARAEPGVWYDPSDVATLYQDTAGTQPVTTAGQTVGLMLDKSRGLALGSEISATGWTNANWDTFSSSGGAFSASKDVSGGTDSAYSTNTIPVVLGRLYEVTIEVTSTTLSTYSVSLSNTTNSRSTSVTFSGVGTKKGLVQANVLSGNFSVAVSTTMTGTISVSSVSIRELLGNHATQATTASRPTYQIDANGRPYLSFDGIDDFMVTPTITPGIDKAQVFAGIQALTPRSNNSPVWQFGDATTSATDALIRLILGDGSTDSYRATLAGAATNSTPRVTKVVPYTVVITTLIDAEKTQDGEISLRENYTTVATGSSTDSGVTSFGSQILYLGRQAAVAGYLNGNIYGLIVRFGANLSGGQVIAAERWLNNKTGAY